MFLSLPRFFDKSIFENYLFSTDELDDHRRELADANDLRSGPDVLENFDDDTRLPPQRVRRRVHRPQAQGICKVRKEPIADLVERRPRVRLRI